VLILDQKLTFKAVKMDPFLMILATLLAFSGLPADAKVLELSDRFIPMKNEGMWLIMFYAPWCGHCKKLEPIWKHVDQSLANEPIRIGRIDCTRFPAVATEFKVHGFPTIIFFKETDLQYSYEGDRTREDIVAFAHRLMGPPVNLVASRTDFNRAKDKSEIFFLFSGEESGPVFDAYFQTAIKFQQHEFFYRSEASLAEKFSGVKETQTIRVYKDGTSYKFDENALFERDDEAGDRDQRSAAVEKSEREGTAELDTTTSTSDKTHNSTVLVDWISRERFPQFVKVTRGRFSKLMSTKKLLVMAVLQENKIGQLSQQTEMESFRQMLKAVLEANIDKYRPHFQFGWTGNPDLANSVAMQTLSLPNLLVVNTTSYQHYLPDDDPSQLTAEAVMIFLDQVLEGSAKVYGGSSYFVGLYRAYYEMTTSVVEMWRGNPALASVLFGLPLGFFALICYSICCADIMDAEDEDEEEELLNAQEHQKTD